MNAIPLTPGVICTTLVAHAMVNLSSLNNIMLSLKTKLAVASVIKPFSKALKKLFVKKLANHISPICASKQFLKAHKLAVRVNEALKAGESLSPTFWNEIDPAYGSDEYQSQGIEAQRAFADRNA